jgi:glycerol-3-phosphate dehydrogenase
MIRRDVLQASHRQYDIIIVGGGIYGIALSLCASQGGLKSLLLEKEDYGGKTTFNSLRILHGGLRYLQKLDVVRFHDSVLERRWFFRNFPDLVKPMPCLMPLDNRGVRRPVVFLPALLLNDWMSFHRNEGVLPEKHLPPGKLVSASEVRRIFSGELHGRVTAGALWFDGTMDDSQILTIEILKWACSLGLDALNYCEAEHLLIRRGKVIGVRARDLETNDCCEFRAPVVINATGPWSRIMACIFHSDFPRLFYPSIAWNVLLNKQAFSDHALALTPNRADAPTYFIRPWKGLVFAGTVHEPWYGKADNPFPSGDSIHRFLQDLRMCLPELDVHESDVLRIYAGLLPAIRQGTNRLAKRAAFVDHSCYGGPKGLYSFSGVKYTTARRVAESILRRIYPDRFRGISLYAVHRDFMLDSENIRFKAYPDGSGPVSLETRQKIQAIVREESVLHLDDLVYRRTTWGDTPAQAILAGKALVQLLGWDEGRKPMELERLQ